MLPCLDMDLCFLLRENNTDSALENVEPGQVTG